MAEQEHKLEEQRESGSPGGGAGRKDEVGRSGVYPMSGPHPPGDAEIRTQPAWGQGERGAAGYEDHGASALSYVGGQVLGGYSETEQKGNRTRNLRARAFVIPELMLIAGTRVALGAGLGLLLAHKLNRDTRKGAGWALLALGIVTSVPIIAKVLSKPAIRTAEKPEAA